MNPLEKNSSFIEFKVDSALSLELRKAIDIILTHYKASLINFYSPELPLKKIKPLTVEFIAESSLKNLKERETFKICFVDKNQDLFSFGHDIDYANVDVILDGAIDRSQLEKVLSPEFNKIVQLKKNYVQQVGVKNLKKLESLARGMTQKMIQSGGAITSAEILRYSQALVDLERELIHSDDLIKCEKILKQFAKNFLNKTKFNLVSSEDLLGFNSLETFLPLPPFKGEFVGLDLNCFEDDFLKLIQKIFFYYTISSFFNSKQTLVDPFSDDKLWESILDGLPFPVVLLSLQGEIYQHNSLFSKLNLTPQDCLKYQLREKILLNDIPYNVFRKDIHHLDEVKVLFVFFTESFFLRGEGNLTPSGQELGIISSSIAHELNNPIAGIQAAIGLLQLDEDMNDEAKQTLIEMKNGSHRCKQLIETFLGFSRANPHQLSSVDLKISTVEVAFQQAQNLLRFRTVESGIRFSWTFSQHSNFRAQINLSLLTMTFYLILGELMTLYSHHLLISDKNQIEKVIKGEIIESSQEIQFQLHELNISSLSLSKLVQNLLTIENFVLQVSDYSLRFIYNPPRGEF
jgi:hypothetical protein